MQKLYSIGALSFLVASLLASRSAGTLEIVPIPIRSIVEVGLIDPGHPEDRDFWRVNVITTTEGGSEVTSVVVSVEIVEAMFSTNDRAGLARFRAAIEAAELMIPETE